MENVKTPSLLSVIRQGAKEISAKGNKSLPVGVVKDHGSERSSYATSTTVGSSDSGKRLSQMGHGTGGNISTPPDFYSPFLTTSSFQIPNNRKEVYLWSQFFYDNDPKIAAGINFYTDFIFSGFKLECSSTYVKEYFEDFVKRLNFEKWLPIISHEYHKLGDCFPMQSIECARCNGSNVHEETGEPCEHEGGTIRSISILNPMQIEVVPGFIDREPTYYFIPDDQMVRIVQTGQPAHLFQDIPSWMQQMILQKRPIPLDGKMVTHFKRAASPWSPYGTPLARSMFPLLAYKDKLRQANFIIAERHILPVRIVKVGDNDRPANEEDIRNVQDQLASRALDPLLTIVTHHAFDYQFVGAGAQVLQLAGEHDAIENDILDGLMLSQAVLSGEGPQYGGNMGLISMDRRLEKFRLEVKHWIEECIFKPEALRHGFIVENQRGDEEVVYPTVKWHDLELRDQSSRMQTLQSMQQAGILSAETMMEEMGLDYDQEVERLRLEQQSGLAPSPAGGSLAPPLGGGFGGGDLGGGFGGGDLGGGYGDFGEAPAGADMLGGGTDLGSPAPLGAPAVPAAPTEASEKNKLYREATARVSKIVQSAMEGHVVPKESFGNVHDGFVRSIMPVTGRAWAGALDKKRPAYEKEFSLPKGGGPDCQALNALAQRETGRPAIRTRTVTAGGKKEEVVVPRLFTKLEQELYKIISQIGIPLPLYAQYQAGPDMQYQLDAAFPAIRLGVEADSETYHSSEEDVTKDQRRDQILAGEGWTILRFTDKEIKKHANEVANVIFQMYQELVSSIEGVAGAL